MVIYGTALLAACLLLGSLLGRSLGWLLGLDSDLGGVGIAMLLLIANDAPLPPEWLDHPLTGDWAGHRECHIGGDFLLIYRLDDSGKSGLVVFVRSGTHSELFS